MELGKVSPHDTEAEQAVIGSMLTDKDAIISAIEVLKEDYFYREDNKIIFSAIVNLYNRSEPVDIITVIGIIFYWKVRSSRRARIFSRTSRKSTYYSKRRKIYKNSRRKGNFKKSYKNSK